MTAQQVNNDTRHPRSDHAWIAHTQSHDHSRLCLKPDLNLGRFESLFRQLFTVPGLARHSGC